MDKQPIYSDSAKLHAKTHPVPAAEARHVQQAQSHSVYLNHQKQQQAYGRSPPVGTGTCNCAGTDQGSLIAHVGSNLGTANQLPGDDSPQPARQQQARCGCKCANCVQQEQQVARTPRQPTSGQILNQNQRTLSTQHEQEQQQPSLVIASSPDLATAHNNNKQVSLVGKGKLAEVVEQPGRATGRQLPPPIRILVERRDDESVRCDCRNCQFFSGWCCMPCAMLIIIVIIVFWATTRWVAPAPSREPDHQLNNKTMPHNQTTTATLNPSTKAAAAAVTATDRLISRTEYSPFDIF